MHRAVKAEVIFCLSRPVDRTGGCEVFMFYTSGTSKLYFCKNQIDNPCVFHISLRAAGYERGLLSPDEERQASWRKQSAVSLSLGGRRSRRLGSQRQAAWNFLFPLTLPPSPRGSRQVWGSVSSPLVWTHIITIISACLYWTRHKGPTGEDSSRGIARIAITFLHRDSPEDLSFGFSMYKEWCAFKFPSESIVALYLCWSWNFSTWCAFMCQPIRTIYLSINALGLRKNVTSGKNVLTVIL